MSKYARMFLICIGAVGLVSGCTVSSDPFKSSSDVTSSTSGKDSTTSSGLLKEDQKVTDFAQVNFEQLKADMALGQGEHLTALATLLGVPQAQHPEFFALTKEKFPVVLRSEHVTPDEMMAALTRELSADPRFNTIAVRN